MSAAEVQMPQKTQDVTANVVILPSGREMKEEEFKKRLFEACCCKRGRQELYGAIRVSTLSAFEQLSLRILDAKATAINTGQPVFVVSQSPFFTCVDCGATVDNLGEYMSVQPRWSWWKFRYVPVKQRKLCGPCCMDRLGRTAS